MSTVPQSEPFTGLILLSGIDTPGITQALFETLSPFAITVLDIEQVVIRDRVILTALIALDKSHAKAVEEDLNLCATTLNVDIAIAFSHSSIHSIAAKTGLLHVIVLGNPLKPSSIALIAKTLAEQNANIERIYRTASYPVTAVEFVLSGALQSTIRKSLAQVCVTEGIDIAVQPGGLMRWAKKLVLMDVDSTLIQQEVIELLAAKAGVGEKVIAITQSAMRGEIDFEKSLKERVALLAGLPETVIAEVRSQITLTPGAKTLIRTLMRLGHTVAVVSGGFIEVIEPLLKDLEISHYRANSLEIIDGVLTGKLTGPIIDRGS